MKDFFGHPRGLAVCFLTEMWERFSYYGMRALLTLYLVKHFLFSDQASYEIFGAYTTLVYLGPVVGGYIADRYLGFRKAVTLGATLLVLGHFGMAFEGAAAVERMTADGARIIERDPMYLQIFYFSLALICVGVAFLKPNISTIVGALYEEGDPRRDSGFTIFYMGINLGAGISSIVCGYLGETFGWKYGFGLAGIGMLLGLTVFLRGQRHLMGHAEPPDAAALKSRTKIGLPLEWTIYLCAVASVGVAWLLVQSYALVGALLSGTGVIVVLLVLFVSFFRCTPMERDRMLVAATLIAFSVLFWALFEQAGSSLNLFTDRAVDRVVLGYEIKASIFQSLNAIFIITLAPLFAALWVALAKRKVEPTTPTKFALALFQVGLGFLALAFGAGLAGADGKVAAIWLALAYFLHTTGELCLSPVGLSMITKLSVKRLVGFMMGVWFLSSAAAQYIGSIIAKQMSVTGEGGAAVDSATALATYGSVFQDIGWLGIAVGGVALIASPLLRRGMHGVH